MAGQKISVAGVIVAVVLIVFVAALGSGSFRNFAAVDESPAPSPTPTPSSPSGETLWQDFVNFLTQLWNAFLRFLRSLGLNV
jgi:hypothetical protein